MSCPLTALDGVHVPLVVPATWRVVEWREDGRMYVQSLTGLSLIISVATESDNRVWIHMSLAQPHRLPTWQELIDAKEWALGPERYAAQVIRPRSLHVNLHPFCLHLFSPADGGAWPLPDFTSGTGSL